MASIDPESPPTRASLKAWWHHFTSGKKDGEKQEVEHPVFGKPLRESLKYASVQISTANSNGDLYVWGYIPVVVAKCGLYLKENATEVEGTFRVNGSNKRMRDLQAAFETPPKYGKDLDWKKETYTTHDVASVFRRYLTQMPEPVIPHDMYHDFRDALAKQPHNQDEVVATYKRLIRSMPRANQYLLLYVLDLLSVFARKSDKNLMTATNLAVIFRPGLISHPQHELSPPEHALSQQVLEFLIAQQDWFMLDIPPAPGSPGGSDADDITVFPSSDEERDQVPGGGWKLVGSDKKTVSRRRTTMDRTHRPTTAEADLSPVKENPPSREGTPATPTSPVGVTRSRTLPSQRPTAGGGSSSTASAEAIIGQPPERERARVLRKQKRSSSSQPRQREAPVSPAV